MNPDMTPIPLDTLLAHVDGMRRLARRLVLDPGLADDVAQDAVLVALSKGPRHGRNVRGWLNGIVRNVARDARRSTARRTRHEAAAPVHGTPQEPVGRTVQLAEQKRLLDAVECLAEPYRDVVWRRYFEGRKPRAIARELDVSVETVNTRLKRARATLRAKLDQRHDGDRRAWALALAPLAASGSSWWLPTLIGGAFVTTKTKVGALAALALLAVGGLWWAATLGSGREPAVVSGLPLEAGREEDLGTRGGTLKGRGVQEKDDRGEAGARTVRVVGRVVDEAARALADVEIRAGPLEVEHVEQLRVFARSQGDGRFAFSMPSDGRDLRVVARAAERLDAVARVRAEDAEELLLRLPAAPAYTFRMLDGASDEPLKGVRCETRRTDERALWTSVAVSDEAGLITVRSPTTDELDRKLGVRISHPGYRTLLELDRPARAQGYGTPSRPRDVYLFRAPRLVIDTRDEAGRPVVGVRVQAWAGSPALSTVEPEWRMDTVRAWSDGSGRGVVLGDGLSDESGRVVFEAGPRRLAWFAYATGEGVAGFAHGGASRDEDVTASILLHPTTRITGRVTDSAGSPVDRARVQFTPWFIAKRMKSGGRMSVPPDEISRRHRTMTDESGAYELEDLPIAPDADALHVQAHRGDLGHASSVLPLSAGAEESLRVDLVLQTQYAIQVVRVVDAKSEPIRGALVTYGNMIPGMLTAAAGEARLVRYPQHPDFPVEIRAFKRGFRIGAVALPAEGEEAVVLLEAGTNLSGRVVDPEGKPVSCYVDAYAPAWAERPEKERGQIYGPDWYGRAHAGLTGNFQLTGLSSGPYFVRFWYTTRREGKHHAVIGEQLIEGPGPHVLRLPETEPPSAGTGIVEGTVVDEEGRIVARPGLTLKGSRRSFGPTLNGPRFRFEEVPPGEWRLSVSAAQGEKKTDVPVIVRPNETTRLRVVLRRSLTIGGRLVDPAGNGIASTQMDLVREDDGSASGMTRTDADGRFQIKGLLPGRYRARIRSSGEPPYYTPDSYFDIGANEQTDVVLRARQAGTLTLSLDDDRFLPYTKNWHRDPWTRERERTWFSRVTVTTSAGEALLDVGLFRGRKTFSYPLAPGNYDLVVKTHTEGMFKTSFAIKAGEDTLVPIVLGK